ncbi:hypothetical protein MCOR05_010682 [Pyricularia oryzae]|nr:hypothetical protein MCOR05_010682 [Pyricularia oryzae]
MSTWLNDARQSLSRLDEGEWLDDLIVNAYLECRVAQANSGQTRKKFSFVHSHTLNQFRCIEKRQPLLESDFILTPVIKNEHWYLLVMYKQCGIPDTCQNEWVVCFLDSLLSLQSSRHETFASWIEYLGTSENQLVMRKEVKVPRQSNSTDCGVYILAFADEILKDPQGFVATVNRGGDLSWVVDAPKLRNEIRLFLSTAIGYTTNGRITHNKVNVQDKDSSNERRPGGATLVVPSTTLGSRTVLNTGIELPSGQPRETPHTPTEPTAALRSSQTSWQADTGSQAATVAFNSPVDNVGVAANPTRSQFSLPSLSPPSSFYHEANQTLTATPNCHIDGATKRTVAHPLLANASPEIIGKRPGSISDDPSPKKHRGSRYVDGDPASALVTPLRPVRTLEASAISVYQCEPSAYFTTILHTSASVQGALHSNASTLSQSTSDIAHAPAFTGSVNDKNTPSVDGWAPMFKNHNFIPIIDDSRQQINMEDMSIIREDGFLHWEDDFAALGAARLEETNLWTRAGINTLRAILTDRRLQNVLKHWFGSNGPHTILHCFWWGTYATEGQPIFFQQNASQVQKHLGVHILPKTTLVEYFAQSHTQKWPVTEPFEKLGLWFKNSEEALQGYSSRDPVSNGFTVFDPRINHRFVFDPEINQFDRCRGIAIIFGTSDVEGWWAPLQVTDPLLREKLVRMEKDDGIGWNLKKNLGQAK